MSIEPIRHEVRNLLAETNYDIQKAEQALHEGVGQERVRAAGRLVSLRGYKAELEARLEELDRSRGGPVDTVIQWIKEDWMTVAHQIETWFERR
jgi:hypothetical protein